MKIRHLKDGSTVYFDEQGALQAHEFGKGVVLHTRQGVMHVDFAKYVIQQGERQIRDARRFLLMVDASDARMHTTEFREVTTDWFKKHEGATVHMLTRSRMLQMALNVANLALGGQRAMTYTDVNAWEAVAKREVPSFTRRPLVIPRD